MKRSEYIRFAKDESNGLTKVITIGTWEYTLQYRPTDLIILSENNGTLNDSVIAKRKRQLSGTVWFAISFKVGDGSASPMRYNLSSIDEYNKRVDYFLNHAMSRIKLLYGAQDTLAQISYLFENNYNLTPQETMLVGFALPFGDEVPKRDMQLSFEDELFKNGIVKATYKNNDLNKIPNLIY